jgi:hypothetical protein
MRPRIRKKNINKENNEDTLLKVKRKRNEDTDIQVLSNIDENKQIKENLSKKKKEKQLLDLTFNLDEKYFYQELNNDEWNDISNKIVKYLLNENIDLEKIFIDLRLEKGAHNAKRLMEM